MFLVTCLILQTLSYPALSQEQPPEQQPPTDESALTTVEGTPPAEPPPAQYAAPAQYLPPAAETSPAPAHEPYASGGGDPAPVAAEEPVAATGPEPPPPVTEAPPAPDAQQYAVPAAGEGVAAPPAPQGEEIPESRPISPAVAGGCGVGPQCPTNPSRVHNTPSEETVPVPLGPPSGASCEQYGCEQYGCEQYGCEEQPPAAENTPAEKQPPAGEAPPETEQPPVDPGEPVNEEPPAGEQPPAAEPAPGYPYEEEPYSEPCYNEATNAPSTTCGLQRVPAGYTCEALYNTPLGERAYACYKENAERQTNPLYVYDEDGNLVGQAGDGGLLSYECGPDDCGVSAPEGFTCYFVQGIGAESRSDANITCYNDNLLPPDEAPPGYICFISYDAQGNYVGQNNCEGGGGTGGEEAAGQVIAAFDAVDGEGPGDEGQRPSRENDGPLGLLTGFASSEAEEDRPAGDVRTPVARTAAGGMEAESALGLPQTSYEPFLGPVFTFAPSPFGTPGPLGPYGSSANTADGLLLRGPLHEASAGDAEGPLLRGPLDEAGAAQQYPAASLALAFDEDGDGSPRGDAGGERTMDEALLLSDRRELRASGERDASAISSVAGLSPAQRPVRSVFSASGTREGAPETTDSALAWVLSAAGLGGVLIGGLILSRRRGTRIFSAR